FGPASNTAEIYDPVADRWTMAAPMNEARAFFAAALLHDGRVLVTGLGTSAEIYDPVADTWTYTAPMLHWLQWHPALTLPDGRVMVAGGSPAEFLNVSYSLADIFDERTGTWTAAADMNYSRMDVLLSPLPDGLVAISGYEACWQGTRAIGTYPPTEFYDPGSP